MLANHLKIRKIPSSEQIAQAFRKIDSFKKDKKNDCLKDIFNYVVDNIDGIHSIQINECDDRCDLFFQTHTTPGFIYRVTINYYSEVGYRSDFCEYFLRIEHAEFINKDLDMNFINETYAFIEDINEDIIRYNKLIKKNNKISFYLAANDSGLSLTLESNFKIVSLEDATDYYNAYFKNKRKKQQALDKINTNIKKYLNELIKDKDNIYSIAYKLTTSYKDFVISTTVDIKTTSKLFNNKSEYQKKIDKICLSISNIVDQYNIFNFTNVNTLIDEKRYEDKYDLYLDIPAEKYFDKIMYSY